MSVFLLDTDTLTLLEHADALVLQNANSHPKAQISLSSISIQEQMRGILAAVNRAREHRKLPKLTPYW